MTPESPATHLGHSDSGPRPVDSPEVPLHKRCAVRLMEVNVDAKWLVSSDYANALEGCRRVPCACEGRL